MIFVFFGVWEWFSLHDESKGATLLGGKVVCYHRLFALWVFWLGDGYTFCEMLLLPPKRGSSYLCFRRSFRARYIGSNFV